MLFIRFKSQGPFKGAYGIIRLFLRHQVVCPQPVNQRRVVCFGRKGRQQRWDLIRVIQFEVQNYLRRQE